MKIYISLPVTRRSFEGVEADCIFAAGVIRKKGHTPVSPLELDGEGAQYTESMGHRISSLLECDAVLCLGGGETKGCQLERAAAAVYMVKPYYSLDEIPDADGNREGRDKQEPNG